jgi:hypothetical protein
MESLILVLSIDLLSLAISFPHLGVALTLEPELGVDPLHLRVFNPGVDPPHLELPPEAWC